nr:glycine receptor subunit alpha-4-like [Cherax quadricarinatus]
MECKPVKGNGRQCKTVGGRNNNTFAYLEDNSSVDYPVGRHEWRFSHGFCREGQHVVHSLTLTQCITNKQFTCDDGTCIPINQVCDRRTQCRDKSDETECSPVQLPRGYQTTLPPPSLRQDHPLPVYLNITLSSFSSISAINNRFTVQLMVRMIWFDQRVRFIHLRRDRQLNIILPSEAETMWVPVVDFLNADSNQHTLVDDDCKVTVERHGQPNEDDIEKSREARVYEGRDNYIRMSRKYTVVFKCLFNFLYYPFNTDYCTMVFRMNRNTQKYVILQKYGPGIRYQGKDKLAEYHISGIKMSRVVTAEPYSSLQALVEMKRRYATQVVTIFIPTTLINVISFSTFLFKWFDFQNRIMVSLTALLVLSTIFSQISDNLPKTSYFKMIDVWFFSSIVFAFLTILVHTLVECNHHYGSPKVSPSPTTILEMVHLNEAEGSQKTVTNVNERHPHSRPILINKIGYRIIITMYAIFFVVFWSAVLFQKTSDDAKEFAVNKTETVEYPVLVNTLSENLLL